MTDLADNLDFLERHADDFVQHWMEDDGNDADDKAAAQQTSDDITRAADNIRKALDAASAMLAALTRVMAEADFGDQTLAIDCNAAIAAAEAAGFKPSN